MALHVLVIRGGLAVSAHAQSARQRRSTDIQKQINGRMGGRPTADAIAQRCDAESRDLLSRWRHSRTYYYVASHAIPSASLLLRVLVGSAEE